ncbi:DNA-binding response regulator [Paenibacillus sambharensis]|uniref:DNA-binding response regulator n=1 Tax=Paenibacillus sambharensis TaxID=1803190 RepID=A0A2W1LMW1_9BACL|nr:response regulator [Paenibacillus sambharensis]PZD95774.1 DNA-binding response regulator [Paenibacillus sambharensis]
MIEILLVDDESYVTESLAKTIPWQSLGVSSVHQASSAKKAIEILEEQSVDIVVSDIRMPEMDGLRFIAEITERWPNIRCVLLTGHADFEYAKKAIQLQVFDYLLKPVNDDEFILTVTNAIESLKDEWEQSEKYDKLVHNRHADIGVLRSNLMHDLVLGRKLSNRLIKQKLADYDIPIPVEDHAVMLLIQLGKPFSAADHHTLSLMEYAVGNIAEEVFGENFSVWHAKAPHDCLLLIVSLKADKKDELELSRKFEAERRELLVQTAHCLRQNVSNYLKGDVSIVITEWFTFPDDIPLAYRSGLSSFFMTEQDEERPVVFLEDKLQVYGTAVKSLEILYKPPTLIHLLESKQWEAAREKLDHVFADFKQARFSREHIYEVYLVITNAFMYMAHKQGVYMYQIDQSGFDLLTDPSVILSVDRLEQWASSMMDKLRSELSESDEHTKSYIIKQVHEFVSNELGQETSVKTIADKVFLHPVYLSKIYKAETGESLGDYIIRMRMERALYLLKHSNKKIYEITAELGYQNPQYFSKMFKKHYGLTPNEFRDQ